MLHDSLSASVPQNTHSPAEAAALLREVQYLAGLVVAIELVDATAMQREVLTRFARELDRIAVEALAHFPQGGP